jgi:hypothetical protein
MNYSKNTDRLDIHINDQAKTITIRQRWKYLWRYDAPHGIQPWNPGEKEYFHQQAVFLIKSIWESAPRVHLRGDSDFAKSNTGRPFQLRFDIEQVKAGEHWTISANKVANSNRFRSGTDWIGRRIILDIQDTAPVLRYFNRRPVYQFPVVHEFGHAIGNTAIPGVSTHGDEYNTPFTYYSFMNNRDMSAQYADYTSIMHDGSDLRARHFDYLLRELNTMIPGSAFYFNSLTRW